MHGQRERESETGITVARCGGHSECMQHDIGITNAGVLMELLLAMRLTLQFLVQVDVIVRNDDGLDFNTVAGIRVALLKLC